jgi:hypothetical protein
VARSLYVEGHAFALRQGQQEPLPGEGCLDDIGQPHSHIHLSEMDEPSRREVQGTAVPERVFATWSSEDRSSSQVMHSLTGRQVADNLIIWLDGGKRPVLELLACKSRVRLIRGDSLRDQGCISQRGTFLRRPFDRIG